MDAAAAAAAVSGDWRAQLQPDARLRVVNKILDTLRRQIQAPGPENLDMMRNIAVRFEEKTFSSAVNQSDYLKRISMKMLTMESKTQNHGVTNQMPSNPASEIPSDPGQTLSTSMHTQSQVQQHVLAQSHHTNVASTTAQGSASLASSIVAINGLSQSGMSMSSSVQAVQQNMFANSQRQVQVRPQQPIAYQQPHHQTANPHLYQQQLQQHQQSLKAKLSHPTLLQSQVLQQQQQSLLSANQMQSPQRAPMQMPSSLHSSQTTFQQSQPPIVQSGLHSEHQQTQTNLLQQFSPPLLQQHPQTALRQQQSTQTSTSQQQGSPLQQPQTPTSQQQTLPQQQQQQHSMGHQSNITSMQQNQLIGQQNTSQDGQLQQYSLSGQQNNIMNRQIQSQLRMSFHQQVSPQSNLPGVQQLESQQMQQQSHLLGSQTMPTTQQYQQAVHAMQTQKMSAHPQLLSQQQSHQASELLMQSQGDQPQPNPSKQLVMSQMQNQSVQLQQKLQQPHPLQGDMQPMQQIVLASSGLHPTQNAIEQQKQPHQSQSSTDSASQTGQIVPDWQEEVHRKIQAMKDLYYAELADLHQKISQKCQQHDATMPAGQHSEQLESLKRTKIFLDRLLLLFQMSRSNIQPHIKERLPHIEKQLMSFVNSNRRKFSLQRQVQQQFPHSVGVAQSIPQPSQVISSQHHNNHGNQVASLGVQGSVTPNLSRGITSMRTGSMPSSAHAMPIRTATQQSIMNPLQPCSNMSSSQDDPLTTMPQGTIGTLHQGISTLQPMTNVSQQQCIKLENQHQQQLLHMQHIKQQIQQQKQPQNQQMFHHQQKPQQSSQLQAHQMAQSSHQVSEMNDLKIRQGSTARSGLLQSHFPTGQRQSYHHQQLKPGPISSPQGLQAPSPQISHQSSPQIDQSLLSSLPKASTPLQSTNSPFNPSPSTPLAPSPIPGDHDKLVSTSTINMGNQHMPSAPSQVQSLAVATPGISPSPLLAEYVSSDVTQANAQAVPPVKSNAIERPIDRLVKAVQSLTSNVLISSVHDIGSVVSMIDTVAGSAPGNGSRAAVGEDLAAMTKCRLQARNFMLQDGSGTMKKMKRRISSTPSSFWSSASEIFLQANDDLGENESTAMASDSKRQKVEAKYSLLEEIKEINLQLIDIVLGINDEDADPVLDPAEVGGGTVVECSYCAVAVSPKLKSRLASSLVTPISPLRLLVPTNYPNCSPVVLEKMTDELSEESGGLSAKVRSKFRVSLRGLPHPMSLGEMARIWDLCVRKVLEEYAQRSGGGCFSSTYGGWENCVTV